MVMPINTQYEWNDSGHATLTDAHGGITAYTETGNDDNVLCRSGAHCLRLYNDEPHDVVKKKHKTGIHGPGP